MEKLRKVAAELNEVLQLDPPIDIRVIRRSFIVEGIREACTLLEERDILTKETKDVIIDLGYAPEFWPKAIITPPEAPKTERTHNTRENLKTLQGPSNAVKKPMVIDSLARLFQNNKGTFITKSMMLTHLQELFPNKEAKSLKKTIDLMIPSRIEKEKGVHLRRIEAGYISEDKVEE